MLYFSETTNGFYDSTLRGVKIPEDSVEISAAEHRALLGGQSEGYRIQAGPDGRPVLVDPPVVPVYERRAIQKQAIDTAAGRARSRFVSSGDLIDAEYVQAESAAQSFADANYTGDVPASVKSWADVVGITAQEAADDILTTAQQWRLVLDQIRAARLFGKAAVDAAPDDSDFDAVAKPYIDQLNAMKP